MKLVARLFCGAAALTTSCIPVREFPFELTQAHNANLQDAYIARRMPGEGIEMDKLPYAAHSLPSRYRQVVEALMCKFAKSVDKKRIKYRGGGQNTDTISGDVACRHSSDQDWETLVDHDCVPDGVVGSEACR